jgi:hypothetical protein
MIEYRYIMRLLKDIFTSNQQQQNHYREIRFFPRIYTSKQSHYTPFIKKKLKSTLRAKAKQNKKLYLFF